MIIEMYTIYDMKTEAHKFPMSSTNEQTFIRAVKNALKEGTSELAQNPEDFAIYRVGTFDDSEGKIHPIPPIHVTNVINLVEGK
jgi:hypothetical protein